MKLIYNLVFQVMFILTFPTFSQSQSEIDSLINQIKYADKDTNKIKLYIFISNEYKNIYKYEKAIPFCEQGLELANALNAKRDAAILSLNLGTCQEYIGDYGSALNNYLNVIKYWESKGDNEKIATLYSRIASFHSMDYDKALEYYNIALKRIKLSGNNLEIARVFCDISTVYKSKCEKSILLKDSILANIFYVESINLIKKSLDLAKLEKDTNEIAVYLNILGLAYDKCNVCEKDKVYEQSNLIKYNYFEQSKQCYEEALILNKLTNNTLGLIDTKRYIGFFYINQGNLSLQKGELINARINYKNALDNFIWELNSIKKLGFEHGIANSNREVGEAYLKLGNFQKSEKHLLDSERIFRKRNFKPGMLECYLLLSTLYEQKFDYKNAIKYYKNYSILGDSLANEESLKDRSLSIKQFDLDKKGVEVNLLTKENELKESNLKRQRFQNYVIILIAILLILLLINSIRLTRIKRKREKIELSNQLSMVKQEALNAQMNSHFIGNTMDSIHNFIESNDKEKASEYLLLFHRLIRKVLENSFQKFVTIENDLAVVKDYFNLEKLRFKENSLNLEVNIDNEIDSQDTMIPPMIFQTLVENSIKHGFKKLEGGNVKISIRKNKNHIECAVEDNGIGRNASMLVQQEEHNERFSYGTGLAERLILISGGLKRKVIDLIDEKGQPIGTRVEFQQPIISH